MACLFKNKTKQSKTLTSESPGRPSAVAMSHVASIRTEKKTTIMRRACKMSMRAYALVSIYPAA